MDDRAGEVAAVSAGADHGPGKDNRGRIRLREGLGVDGDAHFGRTVQHRSRARADPTQPNLRQVHRIGIELLQRLRGEGLEVVAGEMGENVTTRGLDLLSLPTGTRLRLGAEAMVEVTGLRNPCRQLDGVQPGLMAATLARDADGGLIRLAGVMGVVVGAGEVRPGDAIRVELPVVAGLPLGPV